MTKTDMILQSALNSAVCSANDLAEDRLLEEFLLVSIKNAFPSKALCNQMIDRICETLEECKY